MKYLFLFTLMWLSATQAVGQYNTNRNNVWMFGYNAGLDFSSGSPSFVSSSSYSREGCASVCDNNGNLLFYTDGSIVYDHTGGVMPYGTSIAPFGTGSSTQGALIVPWIGDTSHYYIFSLESVDSASASGRLMYCTVDMTLGGGSGAVVPATIGTLLSDHLSEKMIAIPGMDCNIWLVTHRRDSNIFKVFEITAAGISAPATFYSGWQSSAHEYGIGVMKANPAFDRIALANYYGHLELHRFNRSTGTVYDGIVLDSLDRDGYGAEFSPDGSRFYTTMIWPPMPFVIVPEYSVFQYDITAPTTTAIIASKTFLGKTYAFSDLKLAPNDKIYFMSDSITPTFNCLLGQIDDPNAAGTASGYIRQCLTLPSFNYGIGLPNLVVTAAPLDVAPITGTAVLCLGDGYTLANATPGGTWSSTGAATTIDGGGNVTPITAGLDTIIYTVNYGGCLGIATYPVVVLNCNSDTTPVLSAPLTTGKSSDIVVWPNPSTGKVRIRASANLQGNTYVTIANLQGIKVEELLLAPSDDREVHLVTRGVYIVSAVSQAQTNTFRLVVQ